MFLFNSVRHDPASCTPTHRPARYATVLCLLLIVCLIVPLRATGSTHFAQPGRVNETSIHPATASAHLLKDITTGTRDSSPAELTAIGDTVFFAADDGLHGVELWRSDGTAFGTSLVRDIAPGQDGLGTPFSSAPEQLTAVAGKLFFVADDGAHGRELWISDGTAAGTRMLNDIFLGEPGVGDLQPLELTDVNGTLFFTDGDIETGTELWKSDGTPEGTVLVRDIVPGAVSSYPDDLASLHGTLSFVADDLIHGREVWTSDGSAAGTRMFIDLDPGARDSIPNAANPYGLTSVHDLLFFATDPSSCHTPCAQLWKSDGTPGGTTLVTAFPQDGQLRTLLTFTAANKTLFFIVSLLCSRPGSCSDPFTLWKSDGTSQGTLALIPIDAQAEQWDGLTNPLTPLHDAIFFANGDAVHGSELWQSDGTITGTRIVKDLQPGVGSSWPQRLVVVQETLFFAANTGIGGWELWRSDGSELGTRSLAAFYPDPTMPNAVNATGKHMIAVNGSLMISANRGGTGAELWKSDGTPDGTVLVTDINQVTNGSAPNILADTDGRLFFTADDGLHGRELWVSDGTDAGTHLTRDLMPGIGDARIEDVLAINGTLFMSASDPDYGSELWRSDGTAEGTVLVRDLNPGPDGSNPQRFVTLNGELFFIAFNPGQPALWKSDGTATGTVPIPIAFPSVPYALLSTLVSVDGNLFFTRVLNGNFTDVELWRSDGSAAHTQRIATWHNPNGFLHADLNPVGSRIFITIGSRESDVELWTSTGTEAGTIHVKDMAPGSRVSEPYSTVLIGGVLFFTLADPNTFQFQLWRSDGTPDGTFALTSNWTRPSMASLHGALLFHRDDVFTQRHLWTSDGTTAGTQLITVIQAQGAGQYATCDGADIVATEARVLFAANDGQNGCELWSSDGTATGTTLFANIAPGAGASLPQSLHVVGDTLFLAADDGSHGSELWAVPIHPLSVSLPIVVKETAHNVQ